MKKDKNKDLNVINFKKSSEEEDVPKDIVKNLELILEKAKEGKLKTLIMYTDMEEKSDIETRTSLWSNVLSSTEIVGVLECIKNMTLHNMFFGHDE